MKGDSYWTDRNVLVTGGAGFLGSHLAERLVELNSNVRVIDNLERGEIDNLDNVIDDIEFRNEDLRDQSVAIKACENIDTVFHVAFKVGGIPYTGGEDYQSKIFHDGTLMNVNIIEGARAMDVDEFVFTSSACVYSEDIQDEVGSPPITEDQVLPAKAPDYYGWSKLMGELQLKQYYSNYGLKGNICRPFNIIGTREFLDIELGHAIPVLCRKAIEYPERSPYEVFGDGRQERTFVHSDDVVRALLLMAENSGEPKAYNVGTRERVSVEEAVKKIIDLSGKDIEPKYLPDAPTGVISRCPDISRIEEDLGWEPEIDFDDALKEVYEWVEEELEE